MGVIMYPQDITNLYIFIGKFTGRIHPGRQAVKRRIAEYKCEGHTAHGTDPMSVKVSALPIVIFCV
jgi:hypothetical protein